MALRKVLFIVPYPLSKAPSQRFRFEQYFNLLEANEVQIEVQSFLTSENWKIFNQRGKSLGKLLALGSGFIKRIIALFKARRFDFVFIHREATPLGPPVFEWVLAKVLKKKILYDFDDAIWLTDKSNESKLIKLLKWRSKVALICSWSYRVSCGNFFLSSYARNFAKAVIVNPTTIDEVDLNPSPKKDNRVVIGWTGTHSTLKYLKKVESALQTIQMVHPNVDIMVIADKQPRMKLSNLRFVPWNLQTEIDDLKKFDIGLMPLPDDEWANGKCGFKILQYMALGIPAVASPVGVNKQIIENGKNGLLSSSEVEWISQISMLITDQELREVIGSRGREYVLKNYSVASNASTFLSLFE
ncbi:MAG: glycosyltransferase [Chryseolinea sp.]